MGEDYSQILGGGHFQSEDTLGFATDDNPRKFDGREGNDEDVYGEERVRNGDTG